MTCFSCSAKNFPGPPEIVRPVRPILLKLEAAEVEIDSVGHICFDLPNAQMLFIYLDNLETYGTKLENLLDAITEEGEEEDE